MQNNLKLIFYLINLNFLFDFKIKISFKILKINKIEKLTFALVDPCRSSMFSINVTRSSSINIQVEIFEFSLEKTSGNDLREILWQKSATSEIWLERRANYTRSLSVMSMVGYILGMRQYFLLHSTLY